MSFQNKSCWMPRNSGCPTGGDMGYETSSRAEPKRSYRWLIDGPEPDLFCNKKHAVEPTNSRTLSGLSNVNVPLWESTSSFQSAQFTERLFGSEPVRPFNLAGRNASTVGMGNLNLGNKCFGDHYGDMSTVGLSMSHTMVDPSSYTNYAGIRKVKVNQVRDSEKAMSVSMGLSYNRGDNNRISTYDKGAHSISLGPTYGNGCENSIPRGLTFDRAYDNFISVGHTFEKGDGSFMLMGYNYNKGEESMLTAGQPFDKENGNSISIGQHYEKVDGNIISMGPAYNKGHESNILIGSSYGKGPENFISMGHKGDNFTSMGPNNGKADAVTDRGNSSMLFRSRNFVEGDSSTVSLGGFHDEPDTNPSGRIINGYDLLTSQPAPLGQRDSVECNNNPINAVAPADTSRSLNVPKNEQRVPKKISPNNFPSNVKSLLSTGMFDGVPVKYVSWTREKNLRGVIKGTGYLCGCNECKLSKALNAYELERHAGCKTKHPNNHIYFENGKTIYAVVQELKSTPQETLFEAIQKVTGSPINQKNFRIWKASYQAAARELQRIYGKDEVIVPS